MSRVLLTYEVMLKRDSEEFTIPVTFNIPDNAICMLKVIRFTDDFSIDSLDDIKFRLPEYENDDLIDISQYSIIGCIFVAIDQCDEETEADFYIPDFVANL